MFNEETLRNEIVKVWGEYGAHIDVFDEILRRARMLDEVKNDLEKWSITKKDDARIESIMTRLFS